MSHKDYEIVDVPIEDEEVERLDKPVKKHKTKFTDDKRKAVLENLKKAREKKLALQRAEKEHRELKQQKKKSRTNYRIEEEDDYYDDESDDSTGSDDDYYDRRPSRTKSRNKPPPKRKSKREEKQDRISEIEHRLDYIIRQQNKIKKKSKPKVIRNTVVQIPTSTQERPTKTGGGDINKKRLLSLFD